MYNIKRALIAVIVDNGTFMKSSEPNITNNYHLILCKYSGEPKLANHHLVMNIIITTKSTFY